MMSVITRISSKIHIYTSLPHTDLFHIFFQTTFYVSYPESGYIHPNQPVDQISKGKPSPPTLLFKKGSFAAYFKHFQATLRVDPVAQSVITGWLEEPRRAVALLWAPSRGFQALAWPRLLRQLRGMQRPKAQNGRCFFLGGKVAEGEMGR